MTNKVAKTDKIPRELDAQARTFLSKGKNDTRWAQDSFMGFIIHQIQRAKRGEIAGN